MRIKRILQSYKCGLDTWIRNYIISYFPSIRMRNWYLRHAKVKMSKNVRFREGFSIRHPEGITIEDGVSIGPKVLLDGRKGLLIRKNAVIAYESIIWTLNHDYNDLNFKGKGGTVEIGEYAWVCCRSIILPGVVIGKGAVVASGAVVTKDVPPFAVVAGVPAKIISWREEKDYSYGYDKCNDVEHIL